MDNKLVESVERWLRLFAGEGFAKIKRDIPIKFDLRTKEIISIIAEEIIKELEVTWKENHYDPYKLDILKRRYLED